jgi:hypothetical protein
MIELFHLSNDLYLIITSKLSLSLMYLKFENTPRLFQPQGSLPLIIRFTSKPAKYQFTSS